MQAAFCSFIGVMRLVDSGLKRLMKDDTPDYSRYTLEELHDVARRVNKRLYPDRYALVLQEIEKRKRAPAPAPVNSEPVADGPLLKAVRFCGGLVLGGATPYLILRIFSLFFDGTELFYPALHFIAPALALFCAVYFTHYQQECGTVREEYSPTEEMPRILKLSDFQGCLSGVLRFCGGGLLTAIATVILWLNLMPKSSSHYSEGIGYGMAMMFCALVAGIVGGVVFICLPLGRK